MDNPTQVLTTLDRRLDHPVPLVLYGRAALCLGFDSTRSEFATTQDVDGIIPLDQADQLTDDPQFWEAIELTNKDLESKELYLTHLFREDQVILREKWKQNIVPLSRPETRWLKLFRPATIDLILTKMMRGNDEEDLKDIEFLLGHDRISSQAVEAAYAEAVVPDIPELREAFTKAKPIVIELAEHLA